MKEEKIPKGAMRFVEVGPDCFATATQLEEDKPPKLKMVGYSGGIIKNHWYWGHLSIDIEGMSFPVGKYPVLESHDTDKKIAFSKRPITENRKLELDSNTTKFLDTEASLEFQKNSMKGFPYQASIYARPSVVERVSEGETAQVNGMTVKGPISIWRKSEYKEMSVAVFGWDSKTQASAFSKEETEDIELEYIGEGGDSEQGKFSDENNQNEEEVIDLKTIEELKEKYPELTKKLTEGITSVLETKFAADKAALDATISDQSKKLKDQDEQISDQDKRMLSLEKDNAINKEEKFEAKADRIWDAKLSESTVGENLYDKVRNQVSYSKFVKEDKFDEEAFSTEVDTEIKDWEGKLPKSSVKGFSVTEKDTTDKNAVKLAEEDEATVNSLLEMAGQETK